MILVPSPQQPLSGSNVWMYILLSLFGLSLSSCGLFQPKPQPGKLRPITSDTQTKPTPKPKPKQPLPIDTIAWCDTIPDKAVMKKWVICYQKIGQQPIRIDTVKGLAMIDSSLLYKPRPNVPGVHTPPTQKLKLKSRYVITVLMPFMTNDFTGNIDNMEPLAAMSLDFYEGLKIALDSLKAEGLQLEVHVYDSQKSNARVKHLLETRALQESDLIIGPVTRSNTQLVADFAAKHQKIQVSPLNPLADANTSNSLYFKVNPSYESHATRIVNDIATRFTKESKILVLSSTLSDDSLRVAAIREAFMLHPEFMGQVRYEQVKNRRGFSIQELKPFFAQAAENVIIVPSYRDEGFIYAIMRELNMLKDSEKRYRDYPLTLYGMEQWRKYENIPAAYYENTRLHISSDFFVEPESARVEQFKEGYFARYGMPPTSSSFIGYDVTLFFGRMLKEYGLSMEYFMSKPSEPYLHTHFQFEPVVDENRLLDGPTLQQPAQKIKHYENRYLHLLQFKAHRFSPSYTNDN